MVAMRPRDQRRGGEARTVRRRKIGANAIRVITSAWGVRIRTGPTDGAIAEVRPDQAGARKNGPQTVRKPRGGRTADGCRACPNGDGIPAGPVMRPRDAG